MIHSGKGGDQLDLQVNNFTFRKVEIFKYPGVNINNKKTCIEK